MGNYQGSNQRYGGGGGNFQPQPRPQLSIEHALSPRHEAMFISKGNLNDFKMMGEQPSHESVMFDSDPWRKPIPVPQAVLMIFRQCGIPPNHPAFPPIKKVNTTYPDCREYYLNYSIGKIHWLQEEGFFHIPTYTRYVMNKDGIVRNAYNGVDVQPNEWGAYKMVPDGPTNKLVQVNLDMLLALTFSQLPEDFVDYGFRNYSHKLITNTETGDIGWQPRQKVKAHSSMGIQEPNISALELMAKHIEPKQFEDRKAIGMATRNDLTGPVSVGPWTLIPVDFDATAVPRSIQTQPIPYQDPDDPTLQQAAPQQPMQQAPAQQAPMQQPVQQQPMQQAPMQQPAPQGVPTAMPQTQVPPFDPNAPENSIPF